MPAHLGHPERLWMSWVPAFAPRPVACIVCAVRGCGGGFLTPSGIRFGLGGPMPRTIALVVWGRCRPSPDRVSEGASCDRDARGVVTGGFAVLGGEGFLPVLGAPYRGVCRVDGHDRDAEFGGHGHEPGPQVRYGHAGDQLAEPLASSVFLAGLLRGEVEVFDRDGQAAPVGPVQEPGQGVPDLGVAVSGRSVEVVEEAAGLAHGVAVLIKTPGGEVVGVGVHSDQAAGAGWARGTVLTGGIVQEASRYQRPRVAS